MSGILNREAIVELFNTVENGDLKMFGKITEAIMRPNERKSMIRRMIHPETKMCLLSASIDYGRGQFVNLFISEGCDVNKVGAMGFTPFHIACKKGDPNICMSLLLNGAAVNLPTANWDQTYPLHYLVRHPFTRPLEDVLELLIKRGVDIDAQNASEETALHLAGKYEIIEFLIDHGANVNAADWRGETCLHKLIVRLRSSPKEEVVKTVKLLISHGADPYIAGVSGTVLELADNYQLLPLLKSTFESSSRNSIKLPSVLNKRLHAQVVSIPLLLIEDIKDRNKWKSVDITTKHLRHCRFEFPNDASDRKAFIDYIKNNTPKTHKETFAFPFASEMRLDHMWKPKEMDVFLWKDYKNLLQPMNLSHRKFISVACGLDHSAAVTIHGDVWTWGTCSKGELGLGVGTTTALLPVPVLTKHKVQNIYCGAAQTAAITEAGEMYHWGQIGEEVIPSPRLIHEFAKKRVVSVALGKIHACALVMNNESSSTANINNKSMNDSMTKSLQLLQTTTLYSWGDNSFGQLGLGDLKPRKRPTEVKFVNNLDLKSISAGPNHTVALTYSKQVYIWGKNEGGSLGILEDQKGITSRPTCLEALNDKTIREVACGVGFTLALCANGEIYSWGDKSGALGRSNESNSTPQIIPALRDYHIEKISCGTKQCFAYDGDRVWSWGEFISSTNLGDAIEVLEPKIVENIAAKRVFQIACGWRHTMLMMLEDPYDLLVEFRRQGVPNCYWKLCTLNTSYEMCPSYPRYLIIPEAFKDEYVVEASKFRTQGRLPCLTYKHAKNNATITRSSQPSVGLSGRRSGKDEKLLHCIAKANPNGNVLYLLDARPKANAVANQAVGAGYENTDNYKNVKIQFLGIENIHLMRESINKLYSICQQRKLFKETRSSSNWFSDLEATHWTEHIESILAAGKLLAELVSSGKSAHVHCSDGWDRTTQLVCLAQVMLDPYFRTIRGFEVLIEKDWLLFGHRFGDRQGHFDSGSSQVSPIFLQFLDCVWQMTKQFPTSFEFNTIFLIKLFDCSHSGKYGNFLCNSDKERTEDLLRKKTVSLWDRISEKQGKYRNPDYQFCAKNDEIFPIVNIKAIRLWREFFFRWEPQYT